MPINIPEVPLSREEQYLAAIANGGGTVPEVPLTRVEQYLNAILQGGGGASSLGDMSDVDLTGVAAGDGLVFDGQKFKTEQFFPVYENPGYIAAGTELDDEGISNLLRGKPFLLLDAYIEDDNTNILSLNDLNFVRPMVYNSKVLNFEIFGAMVDTGTGINVGSWYIADVEMETDGKTIKTVTAKYMTDPLEVTLTPTAADLSGTYDVDWTTLKRAYKSGRRIICNVEGFDGIFFEPSYGQFGTSGNALCGMMYGANPSVPTTRSVFAIEMYVDGTYSFTIL